MILEGMEGVVLGIVCILICEGSSVTASKFLCARCCTYTQVFNGSMGHGCEESSALGSVGRNANDVDVSGTPQATGTFIINLGCLYWPTSAGYLDSWARSHGLASTRPLAFFLAYV